MEGDPSFPKESPLSPVTRGKGIGDDGAFYLPPWEAPSSIMRPVMYRVYCFCHVEGIGKDYLPMPFLLYVKIVIMSRKYLP
jgi:hypothetical protein